MGNIGYVINSFRGNKAPNFQYYEATIKYLREAMQIGCPEILTDALYDPKSPLYNRDELVAHVQGAKNVVHLVADTEAPFTFILKFERIWYGVEYVGSIKFRLASDDIGWFNRYDKAFLG